MKVISCLDCGVELPQKAGRGRPRLRCDACIREYKNRYRRVMRGSAERARGCLTCGVAMPFVASASYCEACRALRAVRPAPTVRVGVCECCGEPFETLHARRRFCSLRCRSRAREQRVQRPTTTARGYGRVWQALRLQVLAEERTCWLCGLEIDAELRWPDPMSGSGDHIVPASDGGPAERSNARAAHLRCNAIRGRGLATERGTRSGR